MASSGELLWSTLSKTYGGGLGSSMSGAVAEAGPERGKRVELRLSYSYTYGSAEI